MHHDTSANLEFQRLKATLAYHGFGIAASNLKPDDVRNIRATLRTWADYPRCMNAFPTHIRRPLGK